MNILLTCAGRRSYFVEALQNAIGGAGRVLACDSTPDAPALQEADGAYIVPEVNHPAYLDALVEICTQQYVRLLIPSLEPELPLLANQRNRFLAIGTVPVVSSPEVVDTCYDKLAAGRFLLTCGARVPRTCDSLESARRSLGNGQLKFPVMIKPRWGVGSIGAASAADGDELEVFYRVTRKQVERSVFGGISATDPNHCVLIQEHLNGREYGLDVVNDLGGRYVCTFVKHKLRMRAGQTDRAVTVHDDTLEDIGREIGRRLCHVGVLDCDAIVTPTGCFLIDINPRVGGGYPFSHLAGANIPAALIAWAQGDEPDPDWFRIEPNVMASRYDSFLVLKDQAGPPLEDLRRWPPDLMETDVLT